MKEEEDEDDDVIMGEIEPPQDRPRPPPKSHPDAFAQMVCCGFSFSIT